MCQQIVPVLRIPRLLDNRTTWVKNPTKSFIPTCGHCGKHGHVMSDCWPLKRKKENQASPNVFISCKPTLLVLKEVDNCEASAKTEEIRPEFQPFIF